LENLANCGTVNFSRRSWLLKVHWNVAPNFLFILSKQILPSTLR